VPEPLLEELPSPLVEGRRRGIGGEGLDRTRIDIKCAVGV
jgi:hypothetical protein